MRIAILMAALALVTAGLFTGASRALSGGGCGWSSQTPPDPELGSQGASSQSDYAFSHMSDADQRAQTHDYAHEIHNDHEKRLLPATWKRSNGEVVISFERIAPGGCAWSTQSTSAGWKLDGGAKLSYGPTLQFSRNAKLYYPDPTPGAELRLAPDLRIADLHSELAVDASPDKEGKESSVRMFVEVVAKVEGRTFTFSVVNRGSKEQLFSIPELSADKLSKFPGARPRSRWETRQVAAEGETFVVGPERAADLVIEWEAARATRETMVGIELRDPSGARVATGRANVYLPSRNE